MDRLQSRTQAQEMLVPKIKTKTKLPGFSKIVTSGFLLSASTALSIYIHSSFLKTIVPEEVVGYLYTLTYAISFFVMQVYWKVIARFGNINVLLGIISLQMLSAIFLAVNVSGLVSIIAFIVFMILSTVTIVNYDLWLEPLTRNEETGRVRGMFWTSLNLAFVPCPLLAGAMVQRFSFGSAYLATAAALIPAWVIIFASRRSASSETRYRPHQPMKVMIKRIVGDRDLSGVFLISIALYAFYAWMVIYTPLYLLDLGITWQQMGLMFTLMLIPFVLIEYPAGWLADKYLGETEMLTLGFALMGLACLLMLRMDSVAGLTLALFVSRVGASFVEIMRESYFYKKIDAEDLDLIDAFRNTVTVANVFAPLIASILLLSGFAITHLLLILGVGMLFCTVLPSTIHDTK